MSRSLKINRLWSLYKSKEAKLKFAFNGKAEEVMLWEIQRIDQHLLGRTIIRFTEGSPARQRHGSFASFGVPYKTVCCLIKDKINNAL